MTDAVPQALLLLLFPMVTGGLLWLFLARVSVGERRGRALRLVTANVLVLLFLGSVVFAAGEGYYRFIYDTTDSFSYSKASQRWFRRYDRRNAAGFRDDVEYADRIERGKRRITFLGDSFTIGHGVKNVEDRFVNRLRRAHPEWEVHALAELGWDTGDELATLRAHVARGYQVDRVVLVYCLNDVADITPEWGQTIQRILADQPTRGHWVRRHSYFIDTLYHRLKVWTEPDMRSYFQFVRAAYRGPIWAQQQKRLIELRDAVAAAGGTLAVVTFPFLHALGPDYEYQFVHDELDRFWREQQVPHLDLLATYRHLPPRALIVNRWDAHPNEHAHKLAADALERFLAQEPPAATRPAPPSARTLPASR
jgi:lysophospholipase L1-like esterase